MKESTLWVAPLLKRHARVLAQQATPTPAALRALNSLQLADSVIDKGQLSETHPEHALQVVVIGPTQSGKSTLVNTLLDTRAAGISALAGFTVHAQGFAVGYDEEQLNQLTPLLEPMHRVPANRLSVTELDTYALEAVSSGPRTLLDQAVVWDTPDFDSIDAGTYRRTVMNTVAIADIVVLVVSKDKYGDKSVWDILQLIHPLQQPLVICINKLDLQDKQVVLQAFSTRFHERFDQSLPPVILMPFIRRQDTEQPASLPDDTRQALQQALQEAGDRVNRQSVRQSINRFITAHRDQWLAPLLEECTAEKQWDALIDTQLQRAEQQYARDYLNNPDRYDTFNLALAELLTLLEVPGLAPTLTRTRRLVTWPARKLLGVGRSAVNGLSGSGGHGRRHMPPPDQQAETLENILENTLVSLQGALLDQPQQPFWQAMTLSFRQQEGHIRKRFLADSERVRKDFEPRIEEAARELYRQLQSQPALLNTLRAARVTADAAGVALAIKSGGVAPADLILAPAMLSVTTLLTESALGKYLDSVKAELKERQRRHINEHLLQGVLGRELRDLPTALADDTLYARQLEPELQHILAQSA